MGTRRMQWKLLYSTCHAITAHQTQNACHQNTTKRSLRSSSLKTIMPPTGMTQDKRVLKEWNDQALQGSESCLTLHSRRGLHVNLHVSACMHTRGSTVPILATHSVVCDQQQHLAAC